MKHLSEDSRLDSGWPEQGSIFVFVILIFVYARTMDRYDTELEATLQGMAGGKA